MCTIIWSPPEQYGNNKELVIWYIWNNASGKCRWVLFSRLDRPACHMHTNIFFLFTPLSQSSSRKQSLWVCLLHKDIYILLWVSLPNRVHLRWRDLEIWRWVWWEGWSKVLSKWSADTLTHVRQPIVVHAVDKCMMFESFASTCELSWWRPSILGIKWVGGRALPHETTTTFYFIFWSVCRTVSQLDTSR